MSTIQIARITNGWRAAIQLALATGCISRVSRVGRVDFIGRIGCVRRIDVAACVNPPIAKLAGAHVTAEVKLVRLSVAAAGRVVTSACRDARRDDPSERRAENDRRNDPRSAVRSLSHV